MSTGQLSVRLRLVLAAPAALFSAWALLYLAALLLAGVPQAEVEIGFNSDYHPNGPMLVVTDVYDDSPAQRAGLRVGDAIVGIDGRRLENERSQPDAWKKHRAGDEVRLTIRRRGVQAPLELVSVFRWRSVLGDATFIAQRVQLLYPVPFVIVGVVVLFLRLGDRNAWLLALLFGSFATIPDFPDRFSTVARLVRPLVISYHALWLALLGPLFYTFFSVFPASSPIDRRVPWLKWVAIVGGLGIGLPGLADGVLRLPPPLGEAGSTVSTEFPKYYVFFFLILGLASMAGSYAAAARDAESMRKIRVIFWGTVIGLTPAMISAGANLFLRAQTGPTVAALTSAGLYVMPLSFAYAVKQHVLDVPVLIRRSARYLLVQRGFTFLLSLVSIALTLVFAAWVAPRVQRVFPLTSASAITLGAVFGTALLWSGTQVHRRVGRRIDRAFFRAAYDAQQILEDLAEKSGAATDRQALAQLLERHLGDAFHPVSLAVYLEAADGELRAMAGVVPPGLEQLARNELESEERAPELEVLAPDCVVPIKRVRSDHLAGLIVLGPQRSDEPYSREDLRLLASVASQAGTALENICLAEEIARRIDAERRTARELDIARAVQARLLPERPPRLESLDCAARCVQARAVGGDCYDFIELGSSRVGFVLADTSGKGLHAALLMANLQAHLRSQCGATPADPLHVLREVNRLVFQSTATQHYATVFFGVYDDSSRRLRYVSGGHTPPLLLRSDPGCPPVRLLPTAPAIGLFEELEGQVEEIVIGPGDLLAVFSDGITEAMRGDEEFGEERLIAELLALRTRDAEAKVAAVLASVEAFSAGTQSDDLTLLVVQGR